MNIYIGHYGHYDYQTTLYQPLKNSYLSKEHELIFPYDQRDTPVNSKEIIQRCDAMIAEVTFPSTGLGIEIGWASEYNKPIIAVYKKGRKVSRSVKIIADYVEKYEHSDQLIRCIQKSIDTINTL